jgi:hypothetical protein
VTAAAAAATAPRSDDVPIIPSQSRGAHGQGHTRNPSINSLLAKASMELDSLALNGSKGGGGRGAGGAVSQDSVLDRLVSGEVQRIVRENSGKTL